MKKTDILSELSPSIKEIKKDNFSEFLESLIKTKEECAKNHWDILTEKMHIITETFVTILNIGVAVIYKNGGTFQRTSEEIDDLYNNMPLIDVISYLSTTTLEHLKNKYSDHHFFNYEEVIEHWQDYLKKMLKHNYSAPERVGAIMGHLTALNYFYINIANIRPENWPLSLIMLMDLALIKVIKEAQFWIVTTIQRELKSDFNYLRASKSVEAKTKDRKRAILKGYQQVYEKWKSKHKIATDIKDWLAKNYQEIPHTDTIKRHLRKGKLPPFD